MELAEFLQHPTNAAAWEEFERHVPSVPQRSLFHYTSISGLHGIVTSRVLWATDASFLNDPSETMYARGVIAEAFENVRKEYSDPVSTLLDHLIQLGSATTAEFDIFVASFSERADLLGQWIGYTPLAAGVSLGFRPSALRKLTRIRRVVYSKRRQLAIVKSILKRYAQAFAEVAQPQTSSDFLVLSGVMNLLLHYCSLCFKDEAFADEREWRIVAFFRRGDAAVSHRVLGSTLVPYIQLGLTTPGKPVPINRVVIGPGSDPDRNLKSIQHFLRLNGILSKISASRIPYRVIL